MELVARGGEAHEMQARRLLFVHLIFIDRVCEGVIERVEVRAQRNSGGLIVAHTVIIGHVAVQPIALLQRGIVAQNSIACGILNQLLDVAPLSFAVRQRNDIGLRIGARVEHAVQPRAIVEAPVPHAQILEHMREVHGGSANEVAVRPLVGQVWQRFEVDQVAWRERRLLSAGETHHQLRIARDSVGAG